MDDADLFGSDEEECGGTVVAKPVAAAPPPSEATGNNGNILSSDEEEECGGVVVAKPPAAAAPVSQNAVGNSNILLSSDEEEECGGVVVAKPVAAAPVAAPSIKAAPEKKVNIIDDSSSDSDIGARKKRRVEKKKRALRESDSEEEANAEIEKRKAEQPQRIDSEDEEEWEEPEWVGRVHQATQERIFYTQCRVGSQIVKQGDVVEVWNGAGKPGLIAKVMEMYVDRANKQNMFDAQWLYTKTDVPAGVVIPHKMDPRELLETSHFDTNPLETIVKPISVKFLATAVTPREDEIPQGAYFCRYKYDNITGDVLARFGTRNDRISAKSLETKSRGRNAAQIEEDPNKALDRLREKLKDDGKVKRKRRALVSDESDDGAPKSKKARDAKDGNDSDDGAMDPDLLGIELDEVDADGDVVAKPSDGDDKVKVEEEEGAKPRLSLRVRRRENNDDTDGGEKGRKGRKKKEVKKESDSDEHEDDDDADEEEEEETRPKKKSRSKKSKKDSKKESKKKKKRSSRKQKRRRRDSDSESDSESEADEDSSTSDSDSDSGRDRRRRKKSKKSKKSKRAKTTKKDSKKKRRTKSNTRRSSRQEPQDLGEWEEAEETPTRRRGPSFKPAFAVGGGESGRWSGDDYEHDDFVVSDASEEESGSEETSSSSSSSDSTDESAREMDKVRKHIKARGQMKRAEKEYRDAAEASTADKDESGKDAENANQSKRPSIKLKLGKKAGEAPAAEPEAARDDQDGISNDDSFIVNDYSDDDEDDGPVRKSKKQRRAKASDGPVQGNILTSAIGAVNLSPEQSLLQYVQYIATSLLDETFAKDISKDASENYFRPAKRKVESLLVTSRESLVGSMVWKPHFMKAMQQLPELKIEVTNSFSDEDRCQICRRSKHSVEHKVILFGERYDSAKLWASWGADRPYYSDSDEMEDDSDDEVLQHKDERDRYIFASGPACADRVKLYHALIHWKFDIVDTVEKKIEKLRNSNRRMDDAAIITNIIDDKKFIDGIVRNTMSLIKEAETYGSKK